MANLTLRRFPHLLPDDAHTWRIWLNHYGRRLTRIDYDIRVGVGRPAADYHPPEIKQMAIDLSMRRIDALGYTPERIYIFEIARTLGFTAIGQYFAYPVLFTLSYRPTLPIQTVLITAEIQTDIIPVLRYHRIPTYLVNGGETYPELLYAPIAGPLGRFPS